jgi:oligoendopeptidase F
MRKSHLLGFILILLVAAVIMVQSLPAQTEERSRNQIPEQYKWNLADLYPSVDIWEKNKGEMSAKFAKLKSYEGRLDESAGILLEALEYFSGVAKDFGRLISYASMLSDEDKRLAGPLGMEQEMTQLATDFDKNIAFMEPEILAIPPEKIGEFFKEKPGLAEYRQFVDNIQRRRAHTLSANEEAIIAEAGNMSATAENIYSILSNADLPRPKVRLSDGREVTLDAAGYAANRFSPVREDRIKVFNSFFSSLNDFRRTFGTQLNGEVQKNIFYKNVRKYESCLESSLDHNNIPTSVYSKLIEKTNQNLAVLHRYLKLRQRMLGVDTLHYYDMYPSLVKQVNLNYTYDEATSIVKKALGVLGKEYGTTLEHAFKERWIDVYPSTGKRFGAYSAGEAYDVHPYILLNYNGKYDDMSTLAHELGHTMHSYFANKNQPYITADYPIFVAEVASTVNEALLIDYMLKQIKDPEKKLSILGNYLENYRTTLFRQTQFAEFELKIHEAGEAGEALTGDKFTEIYLDILKRYYGHDQGVTVIDSLYGIEWAFIPHFYYNFYVYQYSTSFMAAQALSEKLLNGKDNIVQKYLEFLSSGGSDYAIPTLKKVGIDMTSDEPFNIALNKMNRIMDEMGKILTEIKK